MVANAQESSALLAANPALQRFLQAEGKGWSVSFDRRSGEPMLMQGPGIAWTQAGNDPTALTVGSNDAKARAMVAQNAGFLPVEPIALKLDSRWSGSADDDGTLHYATFRHAPGGYEQHDARLTFVVNHGNLVQIHAERLLPGRASWQATLDSKQAFAGLIRDVNAGDAKLVSSDLKVVALATTAEPAGAYSGRLAEGYEQHLAYIFHFTVPGSTLMYAAQVDAGSGEVLELFDDNKYGTVTGGIYPRTSNQSEVVSPFVDLAVTNGTSKTTDLGGNYSYSSGSASTAQTGPNLNLSDTCGAPSVSTSSSPGDLALGTSTGTDCAFSSSGHSTRAGRNSYYHLNNVRRMGQKWLSGNSMASSWLSSDLGVNVNLAQTCNAYWNGSSVNFFQSGGGCNNTGEISDVMQHEWAHGLDANTKSGSVGDSAKGEAIADTVAILMTHDSCIGPNFFASGTGGETTYCPTGVRDLQKIVTQANIASNCQTSTSCAGALGYECHCESHLLSGAHWKLAQAFVQRYGTDDGWNRFEKGYLRAFPNITAYLPNTAGNAYDAWIAADDDNGNITDGTPNADIIYTAFNAQGLAGTQRVRNVVQCPTTPASPTVSATGQAGAVALSWTATSGAGSYSIFRSQGHNDGAGYLPLASGVSATSYSDAQVKAGYSYSYQVVANVGSCTSNFATAATATPTTGGTANDFSLSASPASLSVAQGGSGTSTISTATLSGSAQSISLSASGLPAGATASFSPASVTSGSSSTMTVSVGTTTTAGTYAVTVTGSATSGAHTASVSLTVTTAGGGGSGVTNGGFESGLTGWTSTGSTSTSATSHTGTASAVVGASTPTTDSSLSQTFSAPSGATQLSFWYQIHCPDTVTYDWASATLKDNTAGTTATMLGNTCSNAGTWVQATAAVTAGHSYTLTLANHDDNYASDPTYTLYDDVAFNSAPPPTATTLTNGTFSSGLTGWTVAGTCTAVTGGAQCGSTSPSTDSSLSQTFNIGSAATTLSFGYLVTCPDTVTYDWATATLKDNVTGTTTTLLAKTCTNTGTTSTVSASVSGSAGHSVTLTLANHDDNYASDPTYTKFSNVTVK